MDDQQVLACLAYLATMYDLPGEKMPQARINGYVEVFRSFDVRDLETACRDQVRNGRYFPVVSELMERVLMAQYDRRMAEQGRSGLEEPGDKMGLAEYKARTGWVPPWERDAATGH